MWEFATLREGALLRRIIRRETVRLVVLTVIAIAAFAVTRQLAQEAEAVAVQDAAEWFRRGQSHLAEGEPQEAATALRRATMMQRGEKRYALLLAEALARSGNPDAAGRALLDLREFSPEDVDVNLSLARLARMRGDLDGAVRYYHHAIYAPSPDPATANNIRLELIRAMLDAGDRTGAVSELIAATVDPPETPDARLVIADLFLEAGDYARALGQYQPILADDPDHAAATAGAVRASFALGDYRQVARYTIAETAPAEIRDLAATATEILSRDWLASRLSSAERRRRLVRNLTYLAERWTACAPDTDLPEALGTLRTSARRAAIGRDSEQLEAAVATIEAVTQQVEARCGESTPIDRALHTIAQLRNSQG